MQSKVYKRPFFFFDMVLRLTTAHSSKPGSVIMIDGEACTVRSNDISKTGKHGASKCRIEAIEIFSGKKKVLAVPGDTKFDVPMIEKHKAQVLSVGETSASVMDLESFETLDVPVSEELKTQLAAEKQIEYWDIEGKKSIMRVL
jgi:translation initiation factor 5A